MIIPADDNPVPDKIVSLIIYGLLVKFVWFRCFLISFFIAMGEAWSKLFVVVVGFELSPINHFPHSPPGQP